MVSVWLFTILSTFWTVLGIISLVSHLVIIFSPYNYIDRFKNCSYAESQNFFCFVLFQCRRNTGWCEGKGNRKLKRTVGGSKWMNISKVCYLQLDLVCLFVSHMDVYLVQITFYHCSIFVLLWKLYWEYLYVSLCG